MKTWPTQSLGHVHEECLWEVIGGWYGGGQDIDRPVTVLSMTRDVLEGSVDRQTGISEFKSL